MRHRPIGLGVQGLADTFMLMGYPFTSPEARDLNKRIFETMYHAALEASCELAEKLGPYETYEGSPVSKGVLQFDMWGVTPPGQCDWPTLREKIKKHGVRNSLLLAPMPTASTAQILGNNESIEPYTSNIYSRRVLSGDFQIVNPHLLKDLVELGLWNEDMKMELIANSGSIQKIAVCSYCFFNNPFRVFLIISRHCIKQCGSSPRRRLSKWQLTGVRSLTNPSH